MLNDRYVFSQLIDSLPRHEFDRCVARYHGNRRIRLFSCFDQFLCMAFAQLTYRESLRDIETCLRALHKKLYHAGFRGVIARSTLADANEHRDWRIYADFAQVLIARARRLYQADGFGVQLRRYRQNSACDRSLNFAHAALEAARPWKLPREVPRTIGKPSHSRKTGAKGRPIGPDSLPLSVWATRVFTQARSFIDADARSTFQPATL